MTLLPFVLITLPLIGGEPPSFIGFPQLSGCEEYRALMEARFEREYVRAPWNKPVTMCVTAVTAREMMDAEYKARAN